MSAFTASSFNFEPSWSSKLDHARMRDYDAIEWLRAQLSQSESLDTATIMAYKAYLIASDLTSEESIAYRREVLPFYKEQYETLPEDSPHRPYCAVLLHYCYVSAITAPDTDDERERSSNDPMGAWTESANPLRYAASKDVAHAFYRLGDLAASGIGSEPKDGYYYLKGAELGHLPCYMALGSFYEYNIFNKNKALAKQYYGLAANLGYERGRQCLESLEEDADNGNSNSYGNSNDDEDDEDDAAQKRLEEEYATAAQPAIDAVMVYGARFDFDEIWPTVESAMSYSGNAQSVIEEKLEQIKAERENDTENGHLLMRELIFKAFVMSYTMESSTRKLRDAVYPFLNYLYINLPANEEDAKLLSREFNPDLKYYNILLHYCYDSEWNFQRPYEKAIATDGVSAIAPLEAAIAQDTTALAVATSDSARSLLEMTLGHAHCALGKSYFNGKHSEYAIPEKGVQYLKIAAETYHSAEACKLLGEAYESGIYDLGENVDEAKRYYELGASLAPAANGHVTTCITSLAVLYAKNNDPANMIAMYEKAGYLQKDMDSLAMLGAAYFKDDEYLSPLIPVKDPSKAEEYLLVAAQADNGTAQFSLGCLYCDVHKDYVKGMHWLREAQKNGAWGVHNKIEELYEQGLVKDE